MRKLILFNFLAVIAGALTAATPTVDAVAMDALAAEQLMLAPADVELMELDAALLDGGGGRANHNKYE